MAHTEAGLPVQKHNVPARVRVLDLPVDCMTMEMAVEWVAGAIAADRLQRVVVTNANKAWLAQRNPAVRELLESADLVIPEYATVWAARRLGIDGIHQVGGFTLAVRLLAEAPARDWSVYLLGARPEVVATLAARLRREQPALRLLGAHHGYLDDGAEATVHRQLAELRPDLLFVAMGSPRQEQFVGRLGTDMARVAIGVGGSFDILAGFKKDVPPWMRGSGLEWLYRMAQDPVRLWRRYAVTNPWFVARVCQEVLWRRRR